MKLPCFEFSVSSSVDTGANHCLHFIWTRLSFMLNNCETSFKLQSTILKLKSCEVASLAAIISSLS
jgi:hypothetical protein